MKNKIKKWIIIFFFICFLFALFFLLRFYNKLCEGYENGSLPMTAVIVEPRQHKALEFVLQNFTDNLPNNWNIIVMHGRDNKEFVQRIIDKNSINRITMVNLDVGNLTIDDYNKLLKSREFHSHIPTETFLVFQTDTVICNFSLLSEFIEYDYVGAPWSSGNVGNGGLSLRKKSKMLEIIDKCPMTAENEDLFFGNACDGVSISKPTKEEAKLFSVEQVYSDKSFGVHKPWAYLSETEMNEKMNKCSPLGRLRELNK